MSQNVYLCADALRQARTVNDGTYRHHLTVVFGAATSRQPPDANNTRTAADAAPNSGQARNENRDW